MEAKVKTETGQKEEKKREALKIDSNISPGTRGQIVQHGCLIRDIRARGSWWQVILCSDLLWFNAYLLPSLAVLSSSLLIFLPWILCSLTSHMVVNWVLLQSSQGSTLVDLMQQIKLWHLLALLKTAQSAFALNPAPLSHQLSNPSFFSPNQKIGHLPLKFKP